MKFKVRLNRDGEKELKEFSLSDNLNKAEAKPTVLDVLLDARNSDSGLAFRYGCRNRLCGVCTVNVNGKPRLACRTPARDNMRIEPPSGLPVAQDLVVRRDAVNRQLHGKLPTVELTEDARTKDHKAYDSLGRCIECYACLDGCPLHAKNDLEKRSDNGSNKGFEYANPYSFLRIQRNLKHPAIQTEQAIQAIGLASDLGLDMCVECDGCTCGVGIDLMKEVIQPLLDRANSSVEN